MQQRRPNRTIFTITFLALGLLLTVNLFAQSGTATLRGMVTDPSGAVIPGAMLTLTSADGHAVTAQSGQGGSYEFRNLAAGVYTLSATANGFANFEQQKVNLAAGQTLKQDVALQIAVEKQDVTVNDQSATVDTSADNNASQLVIKGAALDALSDDPDELQSELSALAGPAAGPNGGQIYIDGFTGGQLPPKSSIREIRINQNPFSAEYDKLGYGRIEILTKPGTDKLHGMLMASGNDSSFNALNPFVTSEPAYYSDFFLGNVSGALGKKSSFFLSAFRRDQQDNSIINATTGLSSTGSGINFTEAFANPRSRLDVSPRFDFQLGQNNTLTVRYMLDKINETNDGVGQLAIASQAYNTRNTQQTLQVSDTQILGANLINETRFQYERDRDNQISQNTDTSITVQGAFTGGGNNEGMIQDNQDHFELQNNTTLVHGAHNIKFGTRLRAIRDSNSSTSGFNGNFIFASLADYAAGKPSQYSVTSGQAVSKVTLFDAALYATDDWRVKPNFTLSYGLRYEAQNHISDHGDLAPRVSMAWALGGGSGKPAKSVLRAGYGFFFDRFAYNYVLQAERQNGITQKQYVIDNPTSYPNLPSLTGATSTPTYYQVASNLRAPITMEGAIGIDRQISKNATVAVTYINSRGTHQLLSDNINAPLASGLRPNGIDENIYQFQSGGVFNQNQLIANFNVRAKKLSLFGFYMLGSAKADTSGATYFPSNSFDPGADYGRAGFDVRNRFVLGANLPMKYGFSVSPFMVYNSGTPFNLTTGTDLNGDTEFNDRPAFATDLSRASVVQTSLGNFDTDPIAGEKIVPINYGTGPGQFSTNLRVSKSFGIGPKVESSNAARGMGGPGGGGPPPGGGGPGGGGPPGGGLGPGGLSGNKGGPPQLGGAVTRRYNLSFVVMAHNVFNNVNLAQPVGVVTSSKFDQSTALSGGFFSSQSSNRSIDLQMNFSF